VDALYGQMLMDNNVQAATLLVSVVKSEHLTINVLHVQMDLISMMEIVEVAQMVIGQMIAPTLVTLVMIHVGYVTVLHNMIVPLVILPMDSISKTMDNVSDLAQIPIMLMYHQENAKNVMQVVKLVVINIMIAVLLAQKVSTYTSMEHVSLHAQMDTMKTTLL
jgi:hypothetical protein